MQNKTFDEEYSGGYLWAPQKGNNGSGAHHSWARMKDVKEGDVILHGYKQQVFAISIARVDFYPAMRPDELAADWHREGWRADTEYLILENAIYPKDIWNELEPLLPSMYSPFSRNGSGNQGYLFNTNIDICR